MLTGQLRVAPHVTGVAGETRNDPATVLGKCGDKGCIDRTRLVVVRDTVTIFNKLRWYRPSERGEEPGRQPLIERHRQAGRRFRSEQIKTIGMMDVRSFQSNVVEDRGEPRIDGGINEIVC